MRTFVSLIFDVLYIIMLNRHITVIMVTCIKNLAFELGDYEYAMLRNSTKYKKHFL